MITLFIHISEDRVDNLIAYNWVCCLNNVLKKGAYVKMISYENIFNNVL